MIHIYNLIWVVWIKNNIKNSKGNNWKFDAWFYLSLINSFNFLTIALILKWYFDISILYTDFNLTGFNKLDVFINYTSQVALPWFLLSYLCFFYKDRYKKLLGKYKVEKRAIVMSYVLVSMFLGLGVIVLKWIIG